MSEALKKILQIDRPFVSLLRQDLSLFNILDISVSF